MQTTTYGKKQYFTLLGLSLVFILLLPLVYFWIDFKFVFAATSLQNTIFNIGRIVNLFHVSCGAVLIFTYIRYSFKSCLPFIAVQILALISIDIVSIIIYFAVKELTLTLIVSLLFQSIISCAIIFINVVIAKTFAKHIKNEIASIPVIFLAMSILSLLQQFANSIFSYYSLFFQNADNSKWFSLTNLLFGGMQKRLLPLLYNYVYMFVAYLILLAVYDKRDRVPIYFSKAKTAIKRLWDKSADEFF